MPINCDVGPNASRFKQFSLNLNLLIKRLSLENSFQFYITSCLGISFRRVALGWGHTYIRNVTRILGKINRVLPPFNAFHVIK